MTGGRATRLLVTLVVIASTALIVSDRAAAVVPGADGKIAFARQNQVYTINPSGSGLVKLTTSGKNYWPRWSPDGKRIAYVNETAAGVRNVWVMNANGSNKQQVTRFGMSGMAFGPAWSPDGRWIAFCTIDQGSETNDRPLARIRSTSPFRSQSRFPAPVDDPFQNRTGGTPTWSPDGTEIAYKAGSMASNVSMIQAYEIATRTLTRYSNLDPSDGAAKNPAYSPDGSLFAFAYKGPDEDGAPPTPFSIVMRSTVDQSPVAVFASAAGDEEIAFAPSGTRVAVTNTASGAPVIHVANLDGSGRRVLTTGYQPDWQPRP